MNTSQVITLVVIIAVLGGSMAYYIMQVPDRPIAKDEANCTAAAAALPLVNVTTGMGMTAAIAECEQSMSRRQKDLFPDLPDGKKYVSDYPELVSEWHPTKNEQKLPEDFLYGSNKKVWWV